jgi:hypothetical protein
LRWRQRVILLLFFPCPKPAFVTQSTQKKQGQDAQLITGTQFFFCHVQIAMIKKKYDGSVP